MRRLPLGFMTLVLCVIPALAQQDFSKVEIKATRVAGNVYMLEGSGGNIGVSVGPDGILIVDDQFAPLADRIKAALKGLGEGKLKFILNTHWHGDHTGGNVVFGPEAPIIAQTNVRKRLAEGSNVPNRTVKPAPNEALPVVTFDQSLSVHFNGEEIRVIHFPHGHTDGDAVIFFTGANVVHMGDDFFNGMFPFVDLDSGGDVDGYVRNVGEVIAKLPANIKIIPGHGPLASLDDLKRFHHMLSETTDICRSVRNSSLERAEGQQHKAILRAMECGNTSPVSNETTKRGLTFSRQGISHQHKAGSPASIRYCLQPRASIHKLGIVIRTR